MAVSQFVGGFPYEKSSECDLLFCNRAADVTSAPRPSHVTSALML